MYRNERNLLESSGIEVIPFELHNDDIEIEDIASRLKIGLSTVWSFDAARRLSELIETTRPDVAHFHNTFPQMSPSVYAVCRKHSVPVVQTLHNFRLICPGALLMRNDRPCEDCVGTTLLPALIHRCYRQSFAATFSLALTLQFNRLVGSYRNNVDRYIALTQFQRTCLVKGGIPEHKIVVKPNFLAKPPDQGTGNGGYALFVGRLTREKGVDLLLTAWKGLRDLRLKVAGDGELRAELQQQSRLHDLPVEFLGFQHYQDVLRLIGGASLLIMPSRWYEGFPMILLEAFACGTPVVASSIGSLEEIVSNVPGCVTFTPDVSDSLISAVRQASANASSNPKTRDQIRNLFDTRYTAHRNLGQLRSIYASISRRRLDS
ncbi:glycosyltransferase family 4 protein [Thiorhodococcus fuscus]|uniref:Glycosyltransferase family 4 protein n=1 Tax=Thiorhodococcus fuscus TaxID=527200 RepID=A0ABW4Y539_9GAMM